MEKFLNFPVVILSAAIIRPIIVGASLGDALVIIGLSALYASYSYLQSKKQPVANKELIDRVDSIEKQLQTTKDAVNGLKLGNTFKR